MLPDTKNPAPYAVARSGYLHVDQLIVEEADSMDQGSAAGPLGKCWFVFGSGLP